MSWTVQKSNNNLFDPPHPGGFRGVVQGGVGGQHFKSPGNFMNCRENQKKNLPIPHQGGILGGQKMLEGQTILGGQKIKSPGNVMNCREK